MLPGAVERIFECGGISQAAALNERMRLANDMKIAVEGGVIRERAVVRRSGARVDPPCAFEKFISGFIFTALEVIGGEAAFAFFTFGFEFPSARALGCRHFALVTF